MLAVRSDPRLAASSSQRLELRRPSGSMPLAILGSSQLSYGGVLLRKAARRCRPNISESQYVSDFFTLVTIQISQTLCFDRLRYSCSSVLTGPFYCTTRGI